MKNYKIKIGRFFQKIERKIQSAITSYQMSKFEKCGMSVYIAPTIQVSGHENITIGDNVHIGNNAMFMATGAKIKIGNKVMLAPNVSIITGNHRTDVIGEYMFDVKEKLPENDKAVVIEDDVWIGANVTILKGVTVGEGSVIGANSLVTKNLPPYSIYTGIAEKRIRKRFSEEEIVRHKRKLNQTVR